MTPQQERIAEILKKSTQSTLMTQYQRDVLAKDLADLFEAEEDRRIYCGWRKGHCDQTQPFNRQTFLKKAGVKE